MMKQGKFYTVAVALTVAIGGFLLGFDTTVISGAVPFIKDYFALTGTSGDWKLVLAPYHEALATAGLNINASLVLYAIMGFVASFAISLGPVMWVLLSEIFPNAYRGAAISVVVFWNSVVSASVTFIFPWELSQHFGAAGAFLGYGLLALAAVVFVAAAIPETKGKTLEELEHLLVWSRLSPAK